MVINMYYLPGFRIGVEIRHYSVDCPENIEVDFFLRPNAGRACRAKPARLKICFSAVRVHLQPNSGFRILRDQVDDSLM